MNKLICAFVVVAAAACAAPVKPVRFATALPAADAIDTAVRVLAERGLTVANVDRNAGIIQTNWVATAYQYGKDKRIVHRFTVVVSPGPEGSQVHARVENMQCDAYGSVVVDGASMHEGCNAMDGVVPPDQEALDQLGGELQARLNAPVRAKAE